MKTNACPLHICTEQNAPCQDLSTNGKNDKRRFCQELKIADNNRMKRILFLYKAKTNALNLTVILFLSIFPEAKRQRNLC
jgi:hypothetical protein